MSEIWEKSLIGILYPEGTSIGMSVLLALVPVLVGYLFGSINTSLLLSRFLYHDDIRKHSSGNAGMTNVMRTWGKGAAAATLLGDLIKTAIAVLLGGLYMGENGMYIAGFFAVIGHIWPCFFGFRGGKGVVAALGLILFTEPMVALVLALIFVCIVAATKFISLGSIMGVMLYPLILNRMYILLHHTDGVPFIPTVISFCLMVVVIIKHRENIRRLTKGQENKFSFKKSVRPQNAAAKQTAEVQNIPVQRSEKPDPNTSKKKRKKK